MGTVFSMNISQNYVETLTVQNGQREVFDYSFPHSGSFGLRASYGGKKSYFYVYKFAGLRHRITIGQHPTISLEQARLIAGKYAYQLSLGKDPKLEREILGKAINITALAKWFFENNQDLSATTFREYRRIFTREIEPTFGLRPPSSVENAEITALIRRIGNQRGKKTLANRTRALLNRIFSFAIEQGALLNNPVQETLGFVVSENPRKLLDLTQIRILWRYLDTINASLGAMFKMLILTAQPPRRLQALSWADIRLDQLCFSDIKTLQLPLSAHTVQILKSLRFPNGKHEKVFGDYGLQHYSSMQRHFKEITAAAKLDTNCSISCLRKSIEIQLRKMGANHFIVAYVMQKKTEVDRLKGFKALNLEGEVKFALERWSKLLTTDNPKSTKSKVVQLFPSS